MAAVNDTYMARYLQDLYNKEASTDNEDIYCFPSEGTVPRSNYKTPFLFSVTNNKNHHGNNDENMTYVSNAQVDDALVAKYLQELYDREEKSKPIDENIFMFPSEGTVPQADYKHPMIPSVSLSQSTEDSSVLELTQEALTGIVSNMSDAIYDTFCHLMSPYGTRNAYPMTGSSTTGSRLDRPMMTASNDSEDGASVAQENWTEMNVLHSDKKKSDEYDYLKYL